MCRVIKVGNKLNSPKICLHRHCAKHQHCTSAISNICAYPTLKRCSSKKTTNACRQCNSPLPSPLPLPIPPSSPSVLSLRPLPPSLPVRLSLPPPPRSYFSPRMRRANWMSLGVMVTRLAWRAHKLTSSSRPTRSASAASWRACREDP